MFKFFGFFLLVNLSLFAGSIRSLYNSLDPKSLSEQLAFYGLYPDSEEGKAALKKAWELLSEEKNLPLALPKINVDFIINLVNSKPNQRPILNEEQLTLIEKLAAKLKNRTLKGYNLTSEEEILKLPSSEIDLARTLFIAEKENLETVRSYESALDLMALEISAYLGKEASDYDKIFAINDFIFYKKRFRFPPHSIWAKNVDTFTFLSSVMDSRQGVCLGVSILYLCLAQRIGLSLEIVTPPGHIYLRYKSKEGEITNIETTARGIDLPTDTYLSIEVKDSELRNIKEVVGMAFMNKAAILWEKDKPKETIELYLKARQYIGDHPLLEEFLAYNLIFDKREKEAKEILLKIKDVIPPCEITKSTIVEDYLKGKADGEAIKVIFSKVDETKESILQKQNSLLKILNKYPAFRAGLLQLASSYLQLGREKEALPVLKKYFHIDKEDPTVNYYLSVLYFERLDYQNAWYHLNLLEKTTSSCGHHPKAMEDLKRALTTASP